MVVKTGCLGFYQNYIHRGNSQGGGEDRYLDQKTPPPPGQRGAAQTGPGQDNPYPLPLPREQQDRGV